MQPLNALAADEAPGLGDDRTFQLASLEDNRRAAALLAMQAEDRLDLLTRDLDAPVYDQSPFLDSVARLARSHPRARIRILTEEVSGAVTHGHRIIELARQLTSFIQIRRLHADDRGAANCFLLADDRGLLQRPLASRYEGTLHFNAPHEVRHLDQAFERMWERSEPISELRRLHL